MSEINVAAPGRVNLIGEHTDYNDGFVLPVAIDRYIRIRAKKRSDRKIILHSKLFDQTYEGSIEKIEKSQFHWANYILGVSFELQKQGETLSGIEAEIDGNIPIGSGLSSSAAMEVAGLMMWMKLNGFDVVPIRGIRLCQRAENEFVGTRCGIMDQFASALGKKKNALFLDCRSLKYKYVPVPDGFCFAVVDSKVKRQLVDSEYNRRRADCEQGVRMLNAGGLKIKALRDITPDVLLRYRKKFLGNIWSRCEHVVREIERTVKAAEFLKKNDVVGFGKLMYESHTSLRDLYSVSCKELDILVRLAKNFPGVYGSRMTGAGFGGCTVTLLKRERFDGFSKYIKEDYFKKTSINCDTYRFEPSKGALLL